MKTRGRSDRNDSAPRLLLQITPIPKPLFEINLRSVLAESAEASLVEAISSAPAGEGLPLSEVFCEFPSALLKPASGERDLQRTEGRD